MKISSFAFRPLFLGLSLACLALPASAKEKEYKLSQWRFGKVLFGERFSKGDLKGKVVVVENWGVRCPPCVAAMPHLAELDKKHRDDGLMIIGAEVQGHGKSDIKPIIDDAEVEFAITEGCEGPIEFNAIPRCHIFGRDGILVYDGSPGGAEFEEALEKALEEGGGAEEEEEAKPAGPLIASKNWTNSDGRSITAAVKEVTGDSVVFIMSNGKEVTYPLEKLSDASREEIEEAAKAVEAE
ncbi:MAG: TlpA family protein disulfide reductase [Akkermansiaceae bacterium]|jgi:thiol-disulfide isomerase/thioredoxin|nr:TlpA family protein disulfide reductase [Akkermansiaceae bacterium]